MTPMEKEKESKISYVTWCLYGCLITNALLFGFLIFEELNRDWPYIKLVLFALLLIGNIFGIIILTTHYNAEIQSQRDVFNAKLKWVTDEYKECVRRELSCFTNDSSNADDSLSKTLEMITETFSNKNCDDSKLNILQEVIDAIIKSREKERQTKTNK